MSAGRTRHVFVFIASVLVVAGLFWWRREAQPPPPAAKPASASLTEVTARAATRAPTAALAWPGEKQAPAAAATAAPLEGESQIADPLNAPGGTVQQDLRILNEVFEMWLSNFPRDGNPVGENHEITAALTGDNGHRFAFVRRGHPAINASGELCDRWGTPFRFHQLSGRQMEIRSAGPDRKFGTDDDAAWSPQ